MSPLRAVLARQVAQRLSVFQSWRPPRRYPNPRTVWISGVLNGLSTLFRKYAINTSTLFGKMSASKSQTCVMMLFLLKIRPGFRIMYSSIAYSLAVSCRALSPRRTSFVAGLRDKSSTRSISSSVSCGRRSRARTLAKSISNENGFAK